MKELNINTKRKIKFYLPYAVGLLIAITLFIVGNFFDLDVSKKISVTENWFTIIFTVLGIIVTFALGIFASIILLTAPERKTEFLTVFQKVLGVLAVLCVTVIYFSTGAAVAKYEIFKNYENVVYVILGIVYGGVGVATIILTNKYKNKLDQSSLFVAAIMILAMLALTAFFAEIIKYLASRPRPKLVLEGSQTFREWYQWNPGYGFKNGECKSFYSGHAGNSAILVTGVPLFLSLTKLNFKKHTAIIGAFSGLAFSLITSFSRLLGGEHFLTDIAFGTLMSLLFQLLVLTVCPIICRKVEIAYNKWEPKKKNPQLPSK